MKGFAYVFYFTSVLNLGIAELIQVLDQDTFEAFGFEGPKPKFRKPLYTAAIAEDDVVVDLQDEPIVLENCNTTQMRFEFSLDSTKYFFISNPPPASLDIDNCTVLMTNIYKAGNLLQDINSVEVVSLRAMQGDYILAETFLAIFNTSHRTHENTIAFRYDGRDFIGFDYHYFRYFVWTLTTIGFMIIILEIWEMVANWRKQKYSKLEETV